MSLLDFATRTEIIPREAPCPKEKWAIGIDYGFSGIKGFAPNKVFCYPNCAVKIDASAKMLDADDKDIILRDDTGMWVIGEKAHEIITAENAMNYESEMYGRNRYFSPTFQTLMKAGLAIALMSTSTRKYHGETIVVQTGLPPKYKSTDTELLREAVAGNYFFELKVGKGNYQKFDFSIKPGNVFVMDQPLGSLVSTITNSNGNLTSDSKDILRANTLVFDPGFKTLDIYDIAAGMYHDSNTFDTLGMHEVFSRTANVLHEKYNATLTVPNMQNALKEGFAPTFERRLMRSGRVPFEEELMESSSAVCSEAIQKLLSIYNYMQNHRYLIVTGGTGAAWFGQISNVFKDMTTLNLLRANRNDPSLPDTYSNVRGYYMQLLRICRKK